MGFVVDLAAAQKSGTKMAPGLMEPKIGPYPFVSHPIPTFLSWHRVRVGIIGYDVSTLCQKERDRYLASFQLIGLFKQ